MAETDSKWKKTALLVIDMQVLAILLPSIDLTFNSETLYSLEFGCFQNDFILPGGPMLVKGGQAIVPNVIKAVEVARGRGIPIIWVVREHDPLGRDVELFRRHLYSPGKPKPTSKGSFGAELVDGLEIKGDDYKLVKTRFSVQTPNCIRQTVFDAVALDYQSVTVIIDATAAATPEIHVGMQCMSSITSQIYWT
ncbi:probable inactive nicotinamidase At3g16190 isoform X5 [Coffea arabica]|uniref:Probable inactive nicotinamidase At3g16190 isoform X5 n=1 Tax=Coffea arabica TaxID=13443 RepID=A0ABM4U7D1_COFAR